MVSVSTGVQQSSKGNLASKIQYLGHLCEQIAVFSQPSSESWLALVCAYPIQSGRIS
jgi:hypothetical protein